MCHSNTALFCILQICSLMRGGIAERGGVRVGHRIIEINTQSVVATPHEKIVHILSNAVGEVRLSSMVPHMPNNIIFFTSLFLQWCNDSTFIYGHLAPCLALFHVDHSLSTVASKDYFYHDCKSTRVDLSSVWSSRRCSLSLTMKMIQKHPNWTCLNTLL